jgi:hypothetical protein
MNLDESQRKKVSEWISQGLKLSEIQNRLAAELGVKMTYMDVRLLVDDLKLVPKDIERTKPSPTLAGPDAGTGKSAPLQPGPAAASPNKPESPTGDISITVDQIARPGTVVSGKVTFSDGNRAEWYFDQAGRLGLAPQKTGYRPSAADVQKFQMALEGELSRMGL